MKLKSIALATLVFGVASLNCTLYRLYFAEYKKDSTVPESTEVDYDAPPTYGEYKELVTQVTFSLGDAGSIALCEKIRD